MMQVFNQPSPEESCESRRNSTVTPQVFTLFNSQDTLSRSIGLAINLSQQNKDRESTVKALFQRVYGREPTSAEQRLCLSHWIKMENKHNDLTFEPRVFPKEVTRAAVDELTGTAFPFVERLFGFDEYVPDPGLADVDASTRALADLCLVVFNSNEFIYVY